MATDPFDEMNDLDIFTTLGPIDGVPAIDTNPMWPFDDPNPLPAVDLTLPLDDVADVQDLDTLFAFGLAASADVPNFSEGTKGVTIHSDDEPVPPLTDINSNHNQDVCSTNEKQEIVVKTTVVVESPNFFDSFREGIIHINVKKPISVCVQPSPSQHVRYEKDNKKSLRYTKGADGKPIKIDLSEMLDLWNFYQENRLGLWMRITRTTVDNSEDIFRHLYPIWIKSNKAKVYDGSLYIQITVDDITTGYLEIENLVMIILKQDELQTIDRVAVYDPSKIVFTKTCYTCTNNAKKMIEHYRLRQSKLCFQIMIIDENKMLFPTDCCCETVTLTEHRGNESQKSGSEIDKQLSAQDYTGTCQLAQQTPARAKKRKASQEQAQLPTTKLKKAKSTRKSSSSINR